MHLAILLVHYHTPDLAARSVQALLRDIAASDLPAELILVDNGSDAAGRELLRSLPLRLIEPGENLGYAGGINRGAAATAAELLVAMNPDVMVEPGCLAALSEALLAGVAAAGPRFFLDPDKRLSIPPTERRGLLPELVAALATRGEPWAGRARRSWRRHARRHWLARRPLRSHSLSGALLAFTREALEQVGPFDEGMRLYFEEDDWLMRLARRGLAARYVPAAEAVHLYNRSAGAEPRAAEWFAASRERFVRRWYGGGFLRLLGRLAAEKDRGVPWPPALPPGPPRLDLDPAPAGREPLWVELATSPVGFPAAAERLRPDFAGPWRLPPEVWEGLAPGRYVLQVTDGAGRERMRRSFVKGPRKAEEER